MNDSFSVDRDGHRHGGSDAGAIGDGQFDVSFSLTGTDVSPLRLIRSLPSSKSQRQDTIVRPVGVAEVDASNVSQKSCRSLQHW